MSAHQLLEAGVNFSQFCLELVRTAIKRTRCKVDNETPGSGDRAVFQFGRPRKPAAVCWVGSGGIDAR